MLNYQSDPTKPQKRSAPSPVDAVGVKRRGLLKFGTLATAVTGASALTGLTAQHADAAPAPAAPPDKMSEAYATTEQVAATIAKPVGVAVSTDVTLSATDAGKVLAFADGVDHTVTVPLASAASVAAGSELDIVSTGVGRIRLQPPAENLWPYPDGETGTSGIWYGRVGNTSAVSGIGPGGDNVVRSTSTGPSSSGGFGIYSLIVKLAEMGIKTGDHISARMWISHMSSSTNTRFEIAFMVGTTQLSKTAQIPTAGTGVRSIANLVVPIGCDGVQLVVYTTSPTAGATVDIAQVMLTKSAVAPPTYFDGDSAGWYWLGTPHASPSSNGILIGDRTVPKNGRIRLRHLGADVWTIATMGIPDTVLTDGSVLNVDRDNGQGGLVGPTRTIGCSVSNVVSNTAYAVRICPSRAMLIKSIGFRVGSPSGSDDPVDVAIVDSAGTRLVSSGPTRGKLNSTGSKTVTVPDTLIQSGGIYYAVLAASSNVSLLHASVLGDAFGTAMPLAEAMVKASTFPVGTTLTGMTVTDSAPLLWVKES